MQCEKVIQRLKYLKTSRRRRASSQISEQIVYISIFISTYGFILFFRFVIYYCVAIIGIFGGFLLGVSSGSGLSFFDWDMLKLIRRIDIQPTHVYWAENASLVALATSDQYFILKYHADAIANVAENAEDIENAFEVHLYLITLTSFLFFS